MPTKILNKIKLIPINSKEIFGCYTSAHVQHFLEICSTFTISGVPRDAILLRHFPFSLLGRAKQWFYATKEKNTTWALCSTNFLAKFFPMGKGKTNALRGKITSFQQQHDESVLEA